MRVLDGTEDRALKGRNCDEIERDQDSLIDWCSKGIPESTEALEIQTNFFDRNLGK
jgi:hypothetical protein